MRDAGDAAAHRHTRQARAVREHAFPVVIPDASDAVGDCDAGQPVAGVEHSIRDAGDAIAYGDIGQVGAVIERPIPDVGDAIGDTDAGQTGAGCEGITPDAGDRQVKAPDIHRVGEGHRTAGAGVSRDGDRAVIGRESELGSHRGGQRQEQQERQQNFETRFHSTFDILISGRKLHRPFLHACYFTPLVEVGKKDLQANCWRT